MKNKQLQTMLQAFPDNLDVILEENDNVFIPQSAKIDEDGNLIIEITKPNGYIDILVSSGESDSTRNLPDNFNAIDVFADLENTGI
jgi:cell division septal protein FtsQ